MNNTDRAREVVEESDAFRYADYTNVVGARLAIEVLDAAGLLVTDEIRAVLDAVIEWRLMPRAPARARRLSDAVDAYAESRDTA